MVPALTINKVLNVCSVRGKHATGMKCVRVNNGWTGNADHAGMGRLRVLAWEHTAITWLSGSRGGTQQLIEFPRVYFKLVPSLYVKLMLYLYIQAFALLLLLQLVSPFYLKNLPMNIL